ncbi:CSLREA domain-containing protein [Dokdonella sp.]|uniref:CSLREA domain-containing protein n=1 Tax=Dokdonella sp. TaxID=2291710 RepID=UPI0025BCE4F0|nr:CSLREA domain-containing protein [Dokdonella sp.]MBX3692839.1 CSLREA domain-containing protein [Dokdonella sp.]MCW5567947.1 CSLREA domain-containing protein [Dokdonella sp.]
MKHRLALALALLAGTSSLHAATITVNTTADQDGTGVQCSLREAITAARTNTAYGGCIAGTVDDTIVLSDGTYNLDLTPSNNSSHLAISGAGTTTIRGTGAERTIIDGNDQSQKGVFHVGGNGVSATLEDLTITGGNASSGGALMVSAQAAVTARRVHLTRNTAAAGGAIYIASTTGTATLLLDASTVSDNDAVSSLSGGSAMLLGGGSDVTIQNSTISGNRTSDGTIRLGGNVATLKVLSSTIAFNTQISREGSLIAGISSLPGSYVTLRNSILAHNYTRGESASRDCGNGTFTSQGYNLISDTSNCTLVGQTALDLVNTDPRLLPLFDYGGPTPTLALRLDSPARDAGNPATPGSGGSSCTSTDQRGVSRSGGCDIGAYEQRSTFTVDTPEDGGPSSSNPAICDSVAPNGGGCTIRSALTKAGQRASATEIRLPAGRYFLRSTQSGIAGGDLNVSVDDAVVIRGDGADRTFIEMQIEPNGQANNVLSLARGSLALIGVTLSGGKPGSGLGTGGLQVGATSAATNALLFESAIENSTGFNAGGAYVGTNSSLRVYHSTISRNRADYGLNGNGGGIYVNTGGELFLLNSTISGNIAEGSGGGLYSLGSVHSSFSTISGNRADSNGDGAGSGGGIHRSSGSIFVRATLISGNRDDSSIAPDCAGSVQRLGYNLIGTTSGCSPSGPVPATELSNVAAPLSPLANFGGPTRTHGLLAGNPAINHVPAPISSDMLACADESGVRLIVDQRGQPRPFDGVFFRCDIGASEGLSDAIFIDGFDD